MIIDPVINVFSPNKVSINFHLFDHSIITSEKIGFCIGFLNTSRVDSLYRFRKTVVDKVKVDISILKKQKHSKE